MILKMQLIEMLAHSVSLSTSIQVDHVVNEFHKAAKADNGALSPTRTSRAGCALRARVAHLPLHPFQ